MPTPLASIFSMLDSIKRNLSMRGIEGTIERTGQNLEQFGKMQQAAATGDTQANQKVTEKLLEQVLNFSPLAIGKILYHGGPAAVAKPDINLLKPGTQGIGFYLSNHLNTPRVFATGDGAKHGVVSAYNLPDELYANTLKLSEKPISKYPADFVNKLMDMFKNDDSLRQKVIDHAKFIKAGEPGASVDSVVTGDLLTSVLRKHYGSRDAAARAMADIGIPGVTWQYQANRPAEWATALYPSYFKDLEFLGAVPTKGDPKLLKNQMDNLLNDAGY